MSVLTLPVEASTSLPGVLGPACRQIPSKGRGAPLDQPANG